MTEHNIEHLKVFAGKILTLTHSKEPLDNFSFPIKKLRAMAEYIRDASYPDPITVYPECGQLIHPGAVVPVERKTKIIAPLEVQLSVIDIITEMVGKDVQPTLKNIRESLKDNPSKKEVTALVKELIDQGMIERVGEKRRIVLR